MKFLLEVPFVYNIFQTIGGGERAKNIYMKEYVKPKPGDKVLDLGCGPGTMIKYFQDVRYFGCDPSQKYIESAKQHYGSQGKFYCLDLSQTPWPDEQSFDLIHLTGIMHHLNDDLCKKILEIAYGLLGKGGRLVTLDGCYIENQKWLDKFFVSMDRGKFIRPANSYRALFGQQSSQVMSYIRSDLSWPIPYSIVIHELIKK
jgi:SAM-dependent methyltransferase